MAAVVTAILNFQNGRHWKLKISITHYACEYLHEILCIDSLLLLESYKKWRNVIWLVQWPPFCIFKMAATENSIFL